MTGAVRTLFSGLPRQGPGSDACTRAALRRLPPLPQQPRILDLGCGTGRQTLVLAESLPGARIVAVDIHRPYLDELAANARARGVADRIEPREADMAALDLPPDSFDLIWSEGAIYIVGFARGLALCRPWLRTGGFVAVTECSWLVDERPDAAVRFWSEAYPDMAGIKENMQRARDAGFKVLDTFVLPVTAWWAEYYDPLQARIAAIKDAADDALRREIATVEREIDIFRRDGDSFGYVFYLMRRAY